MNNDKNKIIIRKVLFWGICFVALGGMIFGMIKMSSYNSANKNARLVLANFLNEGDRVKGNKEAKIIITEYSDFQCPACASYYGVVKQLHKDFGDKLAIVYRHFPLGQHSNAQIAALSAESAGRQNKFWEMHDMIFENQKDWEDSSKAQEIFVEYAGKLGLNIEQFKKDLESKDLKQKIEADRQSGITAGIIHTPTFFMNGKEIQNPGNYGQFKNIINQAEQ